MKKILLLISIALLGGTGIVLADESTTSTKDTGNGQEKVDVCHNDNTLNIAQPAVDAHIKHGDTLGKCIPVCKGGKTILMGDVDAAKMAKDKTITLGKCPSTTPDMGNPKTGNGGIVPIVIDDKGNSTTVTLPGSTIVVATLDKVAVSKLSLDVIAMLEAKHIFALKPEAVAGFTALQIAKIKVEAMRGFTAVQIAMLTPEAVKGLTAVQISMLKPEAAKGFTVEQIRSITVEAVVGFTRLHISYLTIDAVVGFKVEQVAKLTRDAVSGFSIEQFKKLNPEVIAGLNADNLGGLNQNIVYTLGGDILVKVKIEEVAKLQSFDLTWIFLNLDIKKVKIKDLEKFLPKYWKIDVSGKLVIPEGKLNLPKVTIANVPTNVELPELPNLDVSLTVGGTTATQSDSIVAQINQTLVNIKYPEFSCKQEGGILKVVGSGKAKGVDFAFIPDQTKITKVAEGTQPGLMVDKAGNFVLITTGGLQITLLPAPKEPTRLISFVPGGKVKVGKRGEVRIEIPNMQRTVVGVFDSVIKVAPTGTRPGITITGTTGVDETVQVVYEDGTMQTMRPTVDDPDAVVLAANLLPDVAKIKRHRFRVDGRIDYVYEKMLIRSSPVLDVVLGYAPARANPTINVTIPDKQVEVININGDRQLFNIQIIGKDTDFGED